MTRCIAKGCTDGPPEDGEPRPRWAQDGLLCRKDSDKLLQRLAELPARRDLLRSVLGGSGGTKGGENRPTKGNPPVPLNIPAHDLLVDMQQKVVSWAQLVAEERSLRGPDNSDLRRLAPWLVSQHAWIVEQVWVDDLAEEMREVSRDADRLTASTRRWHRLEAPCPACGAHDLGRWDGADQVQCAACDDAWPEEQYPRLVRVLASDPKLSVTAAQAAERLGIPASTFRRWAAPGSAQRIKPLGQSQGVARYSVAQVDKLGESA